jgi:hypothetical protein
MAELSAYKGVFTKRSGTGTQAITGVGFIPKCVIFWWVNQTAHGLVDSGARMSFGFDDGTNAVGTAHHSSDAVATSDTSRAVNTTNSLLLYGVNEVADSIGKIQSMDADGFTVNWTTAAGSAGVLIHFLALGGDDLEAQAGSFTTKSGTGAQAVTGLAFAPTALLFLPGFWLTASGVSGGFGGSMLGAATAQGEWAVTADTADGANPSETTRHQVTTLCINKNPTGAGNVHQATLTSLNANGFTIDWSANAIQGLVPYLALRGASLSLGTFTQRTTAGSQSVSTPNITPRAVVIASIGYPSSATRQDQNRLSVGASDGGRQGVVWMGDENGVTPSRGAVFSSDADVVVAIDTVAAIGSVSAIDARAEVVAFLAGRFVINWTDADATARSVAYIVFGDPIEDPPDYSITIDEEEINPIYATFRIDETVNAPDTAVMEIESAGSPFTRFNLNDGVVVTENGVRIFGGYVTGLREKGFTGPNTGDLVVEIQATSYEINAQRRVITELVSQGSPSASIGDTLADLVADYFGAVGVTMHPDQSGGPDLPALTFERERGDRVLQQLAESVEYLWSIDMENRLRAWAPGDISAPIDYDADVNPEDFTGDITVDRQLQNGYANKVILVGEPIVVPDHIDPFTGDGSEDTFDLTYLIGGPYPYSADGAVGYGVVRYTADNSTESIGGLEAPGGFFWEYDPLAQTIRRRGGAPGNGVEFTIQYHGLFVPNATAEDAGEIATYGYWEHVEHITAITDNLSAQDLADAILARKLASKDEIVTLQTRELGFHPGQMMAIECDERVLTGDYLITQVDTAAESGGIRLVRTITAAKSQTNDHDWRRIYQQWFQGGTSSSSGATSSTGSSTGSTTGAGIGLHATHHQSGGIDPIKLDDLATPDDNTDLNVSTARHGLVPKIDGDEGDVLTIESGVLVYAPQTGGGSPSGSDPADIVLTDAYASRPAAGTEGRLFLPSNGFYLDRDTGAAWVPWGPLFQMTAPVDGDFAWINQGGASVVTTFGGIHLTTPLSATVNYRIRKKAAPSTPYTITAWLLHNMTNVSNQSCGVCFRQSSDGKLVIFALDASATGFSLGVFKFTNPTTFSATYVSRAALALGPQICLRIADNGTNRICSVSTDGQNFKDIHSVGRTDFLTADEVGVFVNDQSNTIASAMTLLSWKQA